MDSAKVKVGEAIETMTQLEGWKHVEKWMSERETEFLGKLKAASNFEDVIRLQSNLGMIDKLKSYVRNSIEIKNRELKNEVESHQ